MNNQNPIYLKPALCVRALSWWFVIFGLLCTINTYATILELSTDPHIKTLGQEQYVHSHIGETLIDVGLRYDMGYEEMCRANPNIDPNQPLLAHTLVRIPAEFTLPKAARKGIIVDLNKYRLYFFPKGEGIVVTFPIGIGRKGWQTPAGHTKIIAKQMNPSWHPSDKIIAYAAQHGITMPSSFPGGKGNPLGKHVLRLGWSGYLIHGSQFTRGVGQRISAGCIRMLPEDIEYLYALVKVGTPVYVIAQKNTMN